MTEHNGKPQQLLLPQHNNGNAQQLLVPEHNNGNAQQLLVQQNNSGKPQTITCTTAQTMVMSNNYLYHRHNNGIAQQ